jgi:uncharacterized protein
MRLLSTALALLFSLAAYADDGTTLVLGTATPGGGFALYGQAVADAIRETDPALRIELRTTKGSAENVPLLEAGRLDLALVEGTVAYEALSGVGRAPAKLPVVAAMYSSPGMFVVRADSPYRTISDLAGRRVVFGAASSGLVVLARYVLDGLGLDMHKDFDAVLLESAKDGPPMVLNGDAAALWGGGLGWPGFEAVAAGPQGARFIGLGLADIVRVQDKHAFLKTMTVAAGSYRGQNLPIATVGSWSLILARAGLEDELVYRFARALHRAQPALGQRLQPARETTAANTIAASPRAASIHPAVLRYFRDIGLVP